MGYESKLYFVEKSRGPVFPSDNGKRYASVVATYDACKFPALAAMFSKETDCYIFADDGDTQIFEDRYGDSLKETSVGDLIDRLTMLSDEDKQYRRVAPLMALAQSFADDEGAWPDIRVLHYGH